jgi:hypothetical protein
MRRLGGTVPDFWKPAASGNALIATLSLRIANKANAKSGLVRESHRLSNVFPKLCKLFRRVRCRNSPCEPLLPVFFAAVHLAQVWKSKFEFAEVDTEEPAKSSTPRESQRSSRSVTTSGGVPTISTRVATCLCPR